MPETIYRTRLDARTALRASLENQDRRLSNARGWVALAALLLAVAAWGFGWCSAWWLLAPLALFVSLVVVHEQVARRLAAADGAVAWYRRALDRLAGRWHGAGVTDACFVPADHPYAADLDLFGPGSLFDLLCTARTRGGEETLAGWLATPAGAQEVLARQEAVAELGDRIDLREDLALLGGGVRARLSPALLVAWATAPAALSPTTRRTLQGLAVALSAAAIGAVVAWAATPAGPLPLVLVVLVTGLATRLTRARLEPALRTVDRAARELAVLVGVLRRLEDEDFHSPRLVELKRRLLASDRPASAAIAQVQGLVEWLDSRRNQIFAPVAFLLMWPYHFGLAIERWRLREGPRVPDWLQVLGELEALLSLAGYAFEHPADPFPEIVDGPARFEAVELAHPLMPGAGAVANDVTLGPDGQVWVVSGSNMSGKSTLLRTVGVNAVLALCGAPVRAGRLRLTPLCLGATIRLNDSLLAGESRFYAELKRLRQLMDLATGQAPLLFLLDEILHGTNSHDRRVGAEALLRAFAQAGAIGLCTTHDLAVGSLAEAAPWLRNVHFSDRLEGDRLVFDYKVRPGVVATSNALAWMRAVGLPVGDPGLAR